MDSINPGAVDYHYVQLANILESKIRKGEYAPGKRLPGELAIAQTYEVGSTTVRKALEVLRERGLVVTARARGSFVVDELPPADR